MNVNDRPADADSPPFADRQILLIEDDADIASLLRLRLGELGAHVHHETDGVSGLAAAMQPGWDLLLLDLSLPGCDGMDICHQVSMRVPTLPIIMLTARVEEEDRIQGLEGGADDYLLKPFSVGELVARIKALFRRLECRFDAHGAIDPTTGSAPRQVPVHVGNLALDPAGRTVTVADQAVELTAREFDLLHHFMKSPGVVFRRMELLQAVWKQHHAGYLHTVNSHINRLRRKIEADSSTPRHIVTVWGVGYKLEP